MLIRRLGRLCVAAIAALAVAAVARADSIGVVLDTHNYANTTLTLYFQFTGVDGESVTIANFATDGTLDDTSIATTGGVNGALPSSLTLTGDSMGLIPSEYFEPILLGDSISFAFDVTSANTGMGPLFAMSLVVDSSTGLPPLDDNGLPVFGNPDNGQLVIYDASSEPPLSLFSSDQLGVLQGTVPTALPEPSMLALLSLALVALGAARVPSRLFRLRA